MKYFLSDIRDGKKSRLGLPLNPNNFEVVSFGIEPKVHVHTLTPILALIITGVDSDIDN